LSNPQEWCGPINVFMDEFDQNVVDGRVRVRGKEDSFAESNKESNESDDGRGFAAARHPANENVLFSHDGAKDGLLLDAIEWTQNVFAY
jgi:hypothetical protein